VRAREEKLFFITDTRLRGKERFGFLTNQTALPFGKIP
jgi:hypothetical protein